MYKLVVYCIVLCSADHMHLKRIRVIIHVFYGFEIQYISKYCMSKPKNILSIVPMIAFELHR